MSQLRHEVQVVPIEAVEAGSVLAAPVHDAQGKVLLPENTVLTESALASLIRREVQTLSLRVACAQSEQEMAVHAEKVEARLRHIFRNVGDCIAARDLQRQISEYRLNPGGHEH